jgi:hypothetical protein
MNCGYYSILFYYTTISHFIIVVNFNFALKALVNRAIRQNRKYLKYHIRFLIFCSSKFLKSASNRMTLMKNSTCFFFHFSDELQLYIFLFNKMSD